MTKPFTTPFAENGDVMLIPETAQADGSVSYETGFGPDYSADPLEANAKPVPRSGHNELFNQITGSIGDIQRQGAADWYLEFADDGGYPKNAIVWLDGDRWKSQIDGNATRPNVDEIAWLPSAKFEGGGSGGGGDFGLTGPTKISVGGSFQYKISPYSSFMTYAVSATNGTATISGDTITLTIAPEETANVTDLTVIRSDGARNDFRIAIGAQSIAKPSILSPASGSVDVPLGPLLTASAFMTYPDGADTHLNTDWRIRTMAGAVVWQSLENAVNKTNIQVPDNTLPLNTQLQADVRYRGTTLPVSAWSDAVTFTTTNQSILTPTITAPLNGATGIGATPTFTSTAFATNPLGADTHASSDWQIKNSLGVVIWSSAADVVNKTSITLPTGVLAVSSQYTMEVRYNGNVLQPSQWSPVVSFTTAAQFAYGKYLATGGNFGVRAYGQDVDTFTSIFSEAIPSSTAYGAAYSPDGLHLALCGAGQVLNIYRRNGDGLTKIANPSSLPPGYANDVAFSPDSQYLAVASSGSPYITIYKRNGDVFTKLANPTTLPNGLVNSVAFSPDGTQLICVGSIGGGGRGAAPWLNRYKRNGDVFTKLINISQPDVATDVFSVAYSPDGNYAAVGYDGSNTIYLYKVIGDALTLLGYAPSTSGGAVTGLAFSPDSRYLVASCAGTPWLLIYKRSGDTFSRLANPDVLPGSRANDVAFSSDGVHLAVSTNNSPYLSIYKLVGDSLSKLANPAVIPGSTGEAVAFYPPVLGI